MQELIAARMQRLRTGGSRRRLRAALARGDARGLRRGSCRRCRWRKHAGERSLIDLFPGSARIEGADLYLGGYAAISPRRAFGTPLVVYCEQTLRERARSLRAAVGTDGHVVFGTKAFANVAVLRLLREEGIGADVASSGELAFARAAGLGGDEIVVHGNNKDEAFLRDAAAEGATVVLDAPDEAALAARPGVQRVLVRVTLGVDADTHEAIRTGHHGSKFGLPPEQARALIADALARGLDVLGLHVHVGSQLADFDAQAETIVRLASFAASCRDPLGWTPQVADLGGGFGIRHTSTITSTDAAELGAAAADDGPDGVRRGGPRAARAVARARPLARRAGRRHALSRGRGEAPAGAHVGRGRRGHVRQSPASALRRPLHGAQCLACRRAGRRGGERRRHALRVGRRPDRRRRAARAAAW